MLRASIAERKTDRLDTQLLMRAFLGWLRGELRHCTMAAIPTVEEEDARRPSREREKLVGERTRIVNRLKATLARFGIRGFKPTLRNAAERFDELRTAEGSALPENTRAEAKRSIARLTVVRDQIKEIEQERLRKLSTTSPVRERPNLMVFLLAQVIGISVETADMLVAKILSRPLTRSESGRALRRAHRRAGRERQTPPRERSRPNGQCAGAAGHDRARLALHQVPEAKRLGAMV